MRRLAEGNLIEVSDSVRVERRFRPEVDAEGRTIVGADGLPLFKWIVYSKTPTGVELTPEFHRTAVEYRIDSNGHVRRHLISTMGRHPVIRNDAGEPAETTVDHVWVIVGEANSRDEAIERAGKLAG